MNGRNPKRKEKIVIKKNRLNPDNWLVVKKLLSNLYYEHESLTKFLINKAAEKIIERPGKIYLDNEYFRELLSKKPFISVEEKLKYMKKL